MSFSVQNTRVCWCGNTGFLPFSPEYSRCTRCATLVSQVGLPPEKLVVQNDEHDFYGKQYWLAHQHNDLGFPDIHARARNDLSERNLHWLKMLLKYRLPPSEVLELGCSHGSFVALMRQAGFRASGVEMSPWVVAYGQNTFNVPIAVGPIESLAIPLGSLDVIVLMDVLEHLPDPVATMAHCLQLLKSNGLLLIQTPQFKEEMEYTALVENQGAFLEIMKADEHLYLFSERSVTQLFQQLGAEHIQFEPAIFGQYDMFFVVSRLPFVIHLQQDVEECLLKTPGGRLVQALLDLRTREMHLVAQLAESESDRAARWEQIEILTRMVKDAEAEHIALREVFSHPLIRWAFRVEQWLKAIKVSKL